MPADLATLIPAFRANVEKGLATLAAEGLHFTPYFTLRDPVTQARLWRQSRSRGVIQAQIAQLTAAGCDFIVACLEKAGPADGPWATNALPGLSWHQYGEAVDCYLVDANGKADWEAPKYTRYGQVGDATGMWWGGHFGDHDHWQARRIEPPTALGTMRQINDALERDWPHLLTTVDGGLVH